MSDNKDLDIHIVYFEDFVKVMFTKCLILNTVNNHVHETPCNHINSWSADVLSQTLYTNDTQQHT